MQPFPYAAPRCRRSHRVAALAAALAVLSALAWAQQEPVTQAPSAPQAAEEAVAEAPPGDVPADPQPLEDYEASEQISEDLSVSFPVDI